MWQSQGHDTGLDPPHSRKPDLRLYCYNWYVVRMEDAQRIITVHEKAMWVSRLQEKAGSWTAETRKKEF